MPAGYTSTSLKPGAALALRRIGTMIRAELLADGTNADLSAAVVVAERLIRAMRDENPAAFRADVCTLAAGVRPTDPPQVS